MIKFSEASLEELSENFPQMPNRRLTMENSLDDIHEAKELLMQIKKQSSCIFEKKERHKNSLI
ncbi:hypothetical protein AALB52_17290 [Lachnospiraceae bacterium 38-14]